MKNTLGDLNNHLFAQMERLSDEELAGDKVYEEIARAKSITSVASKIIQNGALVLEVKKYSDENFDIEKRIPKMLEG